MVHIKSIQINMFYYVCKKIRFDKIKIYYDIFRPLCCDQHFLSFIGISIMRVLEQKHSDKTSILTFFKVYSPYIKSGRRRREQDGQALNGPHNKSNIKIGEAGSAISTYSGTIIILPMKGCVRVFRIFSVYEINEI